MELTNADIERFWNHVDVTAACWPYTGYTDRDGYGRFSLKGEKQGAHRVAHHLETGEEPPAVMHRCDNPTCCNPAHLDGGTQAENVRDRDRKGRQARGSQNGRAKLDEETVRSMRRRRASDRPPSFRALAREHDVTDKTVRQAVKGETWKHVD